MNAGEPLSVEAADAELYRGLRRSVPGLLASYEAVAELFT